MDFDTLLPSFLFGLVGMGFFGYGKKMQKWLHIVAGIALMVVPYFITGLLPMVIVCSVIALVPFAGRYI